MNTFALVDEFGVVARWLELHTDDAVVVAANTPPGFTAVPVVQKTQGPCRYVAGVVVSDPAPSLDHRLVNGAWVCDVSHAKVRLRQEVARRLTETSVTPISYGGAAFDADTVARERISGMLARLMRGDGLPVGWIGWRDADNQMHWAADDAETVLGHLRGLATAIEDREQALLIAAWQHKANIEALTTAEAIESYDVSAGWP